ncbi:hypothetical protein ACFRU3_45975 [Streptomyces sp. NPDC056910]|uniref:hypothetical protein n=1 Tax=Streptomyces sp. NPDC056910 TaxID=3345964 RepID=UPI0036BDDCD8
MHGSVRDEILGTAYSDHDLVVFLEGAGVTDLDAILDDPQWVAWRGGPAHKFSCRLTSERRQQPGKGGPARLRWLLSGPR